MVILVALLLAAEPGEIAVKLKAGETYTVCGKGVMCPAQSPICDDLTIAKPDADAKGVLVWKGVAPGTTLCSAGSGGSTAIRAVFRVTVR